jgi:excisionase family DNA binding protein
MRALAANTARREESDDRRAGLREVLSVPEACLFLSIHRNTLYKLIREGEIPAFRLITGGRWKFRRNDLEQWVEDRHIRSNR